MTSLTVSKVIRDSHAMTDVPPSDKRNRGEPVKNSKADAPLPGML